MLKPLAASVAAVGVALSALPAKATPQFRTLLMTLQQSGVNLIADDHPTCDRPTSLGRYEYQYGVQNDFIVCVENHQGHSEELRNTILHEAVHVVQACRNGVPVYSQASLVRASTPEQISFVGERYPASQFHQELEARVVADNEDEVFITDLLRTYCF